MNPIRAVQRTLGSGVLGALALLVVVSAARSAAIPDGLLLRNSTTGQLIALSHRGLNAASWDQTRQPFALTPPAASQPLPGDFDDDGDTDLIVRSRDTGEAFMAMNDGAGGFASTKIVTGLRSVTGASWKAFVGDFGGDAGDDVLLRSDGDGSVVVAINAGGGGQFSTPLGQQVTGVRGPASWQPLPGDFDDDGDDDLLLRRRDTGEAVLARNDGSGRLGAPTAVVGLELGTGSGWTALVADLGGKDSDDVILRETATGVVVTAFNLGDGRQFLPAHGEQLEGLGSSAAWTAIVGSFDGDETEDLMVRNAETGQTAVAFNAGNGRLMWDGAYRAGAAWTGAGRQWEPFAAVVRSAPTSHQFGGANASVDTPAEADALLAAMTDVNATALYAALTPSDQRALRDRPAWRSTQRGELPLVRRVDPSFDDALRDPARQRALQTRIARIVAHDSAPSVSLDVLAWHPNVDVYFNATGVHADNASRVAQASAWLIRDAQGTPVNVDRWWMLDVRNPAARRWWRLGSDGVASCNPDRDQRGALDLVACGYDGLWLDNALTSLSHFSPTPPFSSAAWEDGVAAQVEELRAELDRRGGANVRITANMKWNDPGFASGAAQSIDPARGFARIARAADQVLLENEALTPYYAGVDTDGSAGRPYSVRRILAFADQLHAMGATVQWEKTGSSRFDGIPAAAECNEQGATSRWTIGSPAWDAHVRTSLVNLATALIAAQQGDAVGDMCDYPDRPWLGYGASDLGVATGARTESGGVVQRRYSKGIVLLNPSWQPRSAAVPAEGRRIGTMSEVGPGPVQIAARSAVIVSYR